MSGFHPLDPIVQVLEQIIATVNGFTHNFGWTMVIFAALVTLALWPLRAMQYKSMAEMQVLQPHVKELQARYKNNREELGKAQMALFKEHGVNPAAGCFPLLIQMPILFSLYYAITSTLVPIDPAVLVSLASPVNATGEQIVQVSSTAGLHSGQIVTIDAGMPSNETLSIEDVDGNAATIRASFAKTHAAGAALANHTSDVTNIAIGAGQSATITPAQQLSQPTRVGDQIGIDTGANQEYVIVTSTSGSSWSANFEKAHAAGVAYVNRVFDAQLGAPSGAGSQTVSPQKVAGMVPMPSGRVYVHDQTAPNTTREPIVMDRVSTVSGTRPESRPVQAGDRVLIDPGVTGLVATLPKDPKPGANAESVIVTSAGPKGWTATFKKSHPAGVTYTIDNSEMVSVASRTDSTFAANFAFAHPASARLIANDQAAMKSERWLWIGTDISQRFPQIFAAILAAPDMILLAFYVISMYFTVRYSSPATDPAMQQQQMMMAIVSPLMIAFVGRSWPSALILYWFLSNAFSTAQQFYLLNRIKRKIVVPPLPSASGMFKPEKAPKNVTPANGTKPIARKKRTRR